MPLHALLGAALSAGIAALLLWAWSKSRPPKDKP